MQKMKVLNIEFAPFNVPLKRRLQTLAAAIWFLLITMSGITAMFLDMYLILFTTLWMPTLLYLFWIWFIDRDTCEKGGRRSEWARRWIWLKYFVDYFPARLEHLPGLKLDPRRNYLFCCYPHGSFGIGAFCAFCTDHAGVTSLFPYHKVYTHTLKLNFFLPCIRELSLAMGCVSSSAVSLRWLMQRPEGGHISLLTPGGASEAYNCRPGDYKIVLKNRKGFVKIALQTGAPLVPVISFGETDLYSQVESRKGSLLRRIQEIIRKVTGVAPAIVLGRGFFQYSFGIIPFRKPISVVVGHPIEVVKNENPDKEDIDILHKTFMERLVELFESQKHKYLVNADETHLVIE